MKAEELLPGLPVRFEDAAAGEEGHAEDHHEQHGADREASAGRRADAAGKLHEHGCRQQHEANDLQEFTEGLHSLKLLAMRIL